MPLEEWQRALRREFGREQKFELENLGDRPIFSEFAVTNPETGGSYRVAIRGTEPGDNYCSCPDFAVNTLGTCKHIEWTLARLERKRGGNKALREGFLPPYSEVHVRYGARREVRFRPGMDCPEGLCRFAARFFDAPGLIMESAYGQFERFARRAGAFNHEVRIYDDALALVAQIRDDQVRRERVRSAFPEDKLSTRLGRLLKVKLYPYQREGTLFAALAGRCLIADDMGLGKTIEAIAAVEILAKVMGIQRVLVVGPTSLKHQWKQEIERFTRRSAMVIEGLLPQRQRAYQDDSFYKLTNYDVIHRDLDFINGWSPEMVILDEAQRIKNWQTRRAKAVKQIDSEYAMVLTGTPLENRLEELHSIIEFVDRFHLGPLFRFLDEHQQTDDTGRVVGYRNLNRIKESLAPVLVRRTKKEVLTELPERTDKRLFVPMTEEQWRHHEENEKTVAGIVAKWKRFGFLSDKDQRRLMISLQNMRMSCNSTFLLDKETDHSVKPDECCTLLDDVLEVPDSKTVIFSQWLGTHELLIRRFDGKDRPYAYYHGSLDSRKRKAVIEQFKKDPRCRILLCTDSGGVGLNLQHASVVINMDQPWNPAILEQRVGRVHRLGQHRHVQVYHFVSQGTIEHSMLGVLKFKSAMFAGVLDGGQSEVFLGGTRMKKFMESVENVTQGIPEPMPTHQEGPTAEDEAGEPAPDIEIAPPPPAPGPEEVWSGLLTTGIEFIGKLGAALQQPGGARGAANPIERLVAKDEKTGETQLRIPVPEPETLGRIADAFSGLAEILRGTSK